MSKTSTGMRALKGHGEERQRPRRCRTDEASQRADGEGGRWQAQPARGGWDDSWDEATASAQEEVSGGRARGGAEAKPGA